MSWEHCSASGVQIQQHDFVDHHLSHSAFPGILACLEWCWVKSYMDWLYSSISIILYAIVYIYMSICYHVQFVQWAVFAEQFSKEYCIGKSWSWWCSTWRSAYPHSKLQGWSQSAEYVDILGKECWTLEMIPRSSEELASSTSIKKIDVLYIYIYVHICIC